jgi:universal stress protein A
MVPVMQIRKILVPVDSSEASERALRYAVDLADLAGGAAVEVVHVAYEPRDYLPLDRWIWGEDAAAHASEEGSRAYARKVFDEYVAGLPEALRSRVDARLEFGVPDERILELAGEGGYDLLVLGTHGRTGIPRAMLGSVAASVVPRAPCPVLVVH